MLFAAGAAMSAIDMLSSLIPTQSTPPKTGFTSAQTPFSVSGPAGTSAPAPTGVSGNTTALSPDTMTALLQAQSQSPPPSATSRSAALQDLFSQIDGNGDGKITKSEFETALGAGGTNLQMADDVFAKMDKNGDGNVSMDEMSSALKGRRHGHHAHGGGGGGGGADALAQALDGATSTSSANSDGSTTTTLTYADGTKVTMTQPAAQSTSAANSYNLTELLIQRQAQALATSAKSSLSMNV